jgi:hypothetical protein
MNSPFDKNRRAIVQSPKLEQQQQPQQLPPVGSAFENKIRALEMGRAQGNPTHNNENDGGAQPQNLENDYTEASGTVAQIAGEAADNDAISGGDSRPKRRSDGARKNVVLPSTAAAAMAAAQSPSPRAVRGSAFEPTTTPRTGATSTVSPTAGKSSTEREQKPSSQRRQSNRSTSPVAMQGPPQGRRSTGLRAQTPVQSKRRGSSLAMSMLESPALFGFKQEELDSLEDFEALDIGDLNESINAGTM